MRLADFVYMGAPGAPHIHYREATLLIGAKLVTDLKTKHTRVGRLDYAPVTLRLAVGELIPHTNVIGYVVDETGDHPLLISIMCGPLMSTVA